MQGTISPTLHSSRPEPNPNPNPNPNPTLHSSRPARQPRTAPRPTASSRSSCPGIDSSPTISSTERTPRSTADVATRPAQRRSKPVRSKTPPRRPAARGKGFSMRRRPPRPHCLRGLACAASSTPLRLTLPPTVNLNLTLILPSGLPQRRVLPFPPRAVG